ncbi:protein disulfide-isomerase [Planctomycetales bacterium]|nr:protein disulfide-isomerase [Planctomycetales bacterium]
MVKEIEQIERLLESNQSGACLSYIESLETKHSDRACLTAAKLSVYRQENRWQDAFPLAQSFYEKEPANPVAAAEYVFALGMSGGYKKAVDTLIDAFEQAKVGTAHSALLSAALQIGTILLLTGNVMSAIAIGNQLKNYPAVTDAANNLLARGSMNSELPILLRDFQFEHICPDNFAGKEEFEDAVELIVTMRWRSALAKLESLTRYADQWSPIWRNVAAVRFWLLDIDGGNAALKTYSELPNVELEDAVDVETTRLFLTKDALGDSVNLLVLEYPVSDAEKAYEFLLSAPQFCRIDLPQSDPNIPPPKGTFLLLDRPFAEKGTEITADNVSSQLASVLLYGKETDREARLIVMEVSEENRFRVEKQLSETLGDSVQVSGNVVRRREIPKSLLLVQFQFRFPPEDIPPAETVEKLIDHYCKNVFSDTWCHLKLGLLDGKSPLEAAKDAKYKIRLLAAIQYVEYMMSEETGIEVCNDLRGKLGLPEKGALALPDGSAADVLTMLDEQPIWRWYRFDVEKVPTQVLVEALPIIATMREVRGLLRFAQELLNRPMDSMPVESRWFAFEKLIETNQTLGKVQEALLWTQRARNEANEQKVSDAAWCLHAIPLHLMLDQLNEAQNVVNYILNTHKNDAMVMQALQQLFMQLGLMNQNGAGVPPEATQPVAAEPENKIWTPDDAVPNNTTSGSKLWVPD